MHEYTLRKKNGSKVPAFSSFLNGQCSVVKYLRVDQKGRNDDKDLDLFKICIYPSHSYKHKN